MKCPSSVPDFSLWEKYKTRKNVSIEVVGVVPGIRADFFQKEAGDRVLSAGVFKDGDGKILYTAWGFKDEPHCSFTAVMGDRGRWLTPMLGCPHVRTLVRSGVVAGITIRSGSRRKEFLLGE